MLRNIPLVQSPRQAVIPVCFKSTLPIGNICYRNTINVRALTLQESHKIFVLISIQYFLFFLCIWEKERELFCLTTCTIISDNRNSKSFIIVENGIAGHFVQKQDMKTKCRKKYRLLISKYTQNYKYTS